MLLFLKNILTPVKIVDYKSLLLDVLHKEFESPREGIHLSDLIHCPRQSYFKVILGAKHNERTLAYFFDGAGIHMILQKLFDKYYPGRFKIENTKKVNDILTFTPDIIDTETDTIIEVKTARSQIINYAPRPDHVEQLKAYMAFNAMSNGVVFYHTITKEQQNLFVQWPIHITAKESAEIRKHWLEEAENLRFAIKMNDKTLARHIANNPDKNWMCLGYCDYIEYCDEGRAVRKRIIDERTANQKAKTYFIKLSKEEITELEQVLSDSLKTRLSNTIKSVWRLVRWKMGKTN